MHRKTVHPRHIIGKLALCLMLWCGASTEMSRSETTSTTVSNTETIWHTPETCEDIYQRNGRKFGYKEYKDVRAACEALERHIQYLEGRLQELCPQAGERIEQMVDNVEGVYINYPFGGVGQPHFYHENERHGTSYVSPSKRRYYQFVEYIDHKRKQGVLHYSRETDPQHSQSIRLSEPRARYEVTWKTLTNHRDQTRGLHGEELTIIDRSTNKVLATRTIFYYALDHQFNTFDGVWQPIPSVHPYQITTCKNYHPVWDSPSGDARLPRDSYTFVARVLKPIAPPEAEVIRYSDLARGSGQKRDGCPLIIRLGPNLTPADLQIANPLPFDVEIGIRGTSDSLRCSGILHPSNNRRREQTRLHFYDGTTVKFPQLIQPLYSQ